MHGTANITEKEVKKGIKIYAVSSGVLNKMAAKFSELIILIVRLKRS